MSVELRRQLNLVINNCHPKKDDCNCAKCPDGTFFYNQGGRVFFRDNAYQIPVGYQRPDNNQICGSTTSYGRHFESSQGQPQIALRKSKFKLTDQPMEEAGRINSRKVHCGRQSNNHRQENKDYLRKKFVG